MSWFGSCALVRQRTWSPMNARPRRECRTADLSTPDAMVFAIIVKWR